MYRRTDLEWEQLHNAAVYHLVTLAREQSRCDYTELNRELTLATGLPGFDYSQGAERAAVGRLLGEISRQSHAEHGIMLSALVTHKGSNDEGAGFYKLAADLGEMPTRPTADQKLQAMSIQVNKVYAHYRH
ncbi:hypothetical protein [Paeniglutamicibacter sp. NPDC091659]|uniref:hypothetical protein n=1 Tax=Paeniglutamicibacter sp. NPDC091659 TaxID=3364389 RepID=UPI0038138C77